MEQMYKVTNNGYTALYWAALHNNLKMVKNLLVMEQMYVRLIMMDIQL